MRTWPAMKKGNVPNHLRHAAAILDKRGWTQHVTHYKPTGAVDVGGAIALSFGVPEDRLSQNMDEMAGYAPEAKYAFLLACWDYLEHFIREYPTDWNDSISRTEDEIKRTLNAAADELDATL